MPRKPTTSCMTCCHESTHRSQEWMRMDIKNDTRLLKDRRSNVRGVIHYCVWTKYFCVYIAYKTLRTLIIMEWNRIFSNRSDSSILAIEMIELYKAGDPLGSQYMRELCALTLLPSQYWYPKYSEQYRSLPHMYSRI